MPMKNPLHPGGIVLRECIEPLEISVADAAAHLRVDAQALADICTGRAQISADLAIRLERASGSTAAIPGCACRRRTTWLAPARPRKPTV